MIFWILFLLFSVRWWCKKTFETMGFNASWSQDSTIQCLRPFDYSLKAEGMLLEDVRRPPTPNHPTYTWGWRRRRSWWVEKGLLIKRGQKYLVTDRIVLETRGFWVLEVAFHGETKIFKASWTRLFFIFWLIFGPLWWFL